MKDSIVKLKLVSGEPSIGRIDVEEDQVVIDIVVPGLQDGSVAIEVGDDYLSVSTELKSKYTDPFNIRLYGDTLLFSQYEFVKELGIITIWIPIIYELDDEKPTTIFV